MLSQLRPALVLTLVFTGLTGILYPLAMTGAGQALFPAQAEGSLIRQGDKVVGSELIGQSFADPRHFWPRPSVTADAPYNAAASSGSNLGPTSAALIERVSGELKRLEAAGVAGPVSADAATASGSGLDPHISPAFATAQVARVAKVRGMPEAEVQALLERFTETRLLGFIGEPRVNVLAINLALDAAKP